MPNSNAVVKPIHARVATRNTTIPSVSGQAPPYPSRLGLQAVFHSHEGARHERQADETEQPDPRAGEDCAGA